MNQLQPSELIKSFSFADRPFPIQEGNEIPDQSRSTNPLSAPKLPLTGEVAEAMIPTVLSDVNQISTLHPFGSCLFALQANQPVTCRMMPAATRLTESPAVGQWLIETGTVAAVLKNEQPGVNQADQGGSYD